MESNNTYDKYNDQLKKIQSECWNMQESVNTLIENLNTSTNKFCYYETDSTLKNKFVLIKEDLNQKYNSICAILDSVNFTLGNGIQNEFAIIKNVSVKEDFKSFPLKDKVEDLTDQFSRLKNSFNSTDFDEYKINKNTIKSLKKQHNAYISNEKKALSSNIKTAKSLLKKFSKLKETCEKQAKTSDSDAAAVSNDFNLNFLTYKYTLLFYSLDDLIKTSQYYLSELKRKNNPCLSNIKDCDNKLLNFINAYDSYKNFSKIDIFNRDIIFVNKNHNFLLNLTNDILDEKDIHTTNNLDSLSKALKNNSITFYEKYSPMNNDNFSIPTNHFSLKLTHAENISNSLKKIRLTNNVILENILISNVIHYDDKSTIESNRNIRTRLQKAATTFLRHNVRSFNP